MSQQEQNDKSQYFYRAAATDFMKIPGSPVAYWPSNSLRNCFSQHLHLSDIAKPRQGLATTDNDRFLKYWFECSFSKMHIGSNAPSDARTSTATWFPCQKGGGFRKWYGNNEYVVNWKDDGKAIKNLVKARYGSASKRVVNEHLYFREGITWSTLSSSSLSMRYVPEGYIFETKGSMCFFDNRETLFWSLGFLNSCIVNPFLKCISPTLDYHEGPVGTLPISSHIDGEAVKNVNLAIETAKFDWDSYEDSWDFQSIQLLSSFRSSSSITDTFRSYQLAAFQAVQQMLDLERKNNAIYIKAYGLENELSDETPIEEITLTCNPHFRYGANRSAEEYESLFQCDTLKELISYAIGCMMGRYSIDKPGLILASQGETLQDYLNQIPNPRFMPDSDAILPLTDQEWFADDVTNRVREFVKVVWGEETLQENLAFIAESLCLHAIKPKKAEGALDTIRRYLSTQFYKDHLKTYKKRPIYWLFSSGKEKAFECLVYLHRYNESTLARMRTEYVTPLMGKYDAQHSLLLEQKNDASPAQQRELEKDIKALEKKQTELRAFDEQLKHYADMRIKLDLDDGVKVNYGKFGNLLAEVKAVTGDKGE